MGTRDVTSERKKPFGYLLILFGNADLGKALRGFTKPFIQVAKDFCYKFRRRYLRFLLFVWTSCRQSCAYRVVRAVGHANERFTSVKMRSLK